MSVIGLTVSLTQRLTLSRSRQAACVITMSRGCDGPPLDPADRRARGVAEACIKCPLIGRSRRCAQSQQDGGNHQPLSLPEPKHCGPRFFCWDHVSHKGFAVRLSTPSRVETNTHQYFRKFDLYLNTILDNCN